MTILIMETRKEKDDACVSTNNNKKINSYSRLKILSGFAYMVVIVVIRAVEIAAATAEATFVSLLSSPAHQIG
jgi:hypothetical protein